MYQVSFSSKREQYSVIPQQVSEMTSAKLFDGMKAVALVTVHKSSNSSSPVEVGFQRIADDSNTELSGHGESILLKLDVERIIGLMGWFQDIVAVASQNNL